MRHEQLLSDIDTAEQARCGQRDATTESKGELLRLMNISTEARQSDSAVCMVVARLGLELPGPAWRVLLGREERLVQRAASCLLLPGSGDLVQILMQGDSAWILAVLEQGQPQKQVVLDFGDAAVRMSAKQLDFVAEQRITHKAHELSSVSMAVREVTQEHCAYVKQACIVQAGSMHVDVDQHLRIHSSLATVMADALLKLDGAQIHMG